MPMSHRKFRKNPPSWLTIALVAGSIWGCVPSSGGSGGADGGTDAAATDGSVAPSDQGADVTCGNSTVEAGEACDDGNITDGDGCDSQCQIEHPPPVCGDGTVDMREACDDGNTDDGDGCDNRARSSPLRPAAATASST